MGSGLSGRLGNQRTVTSGVYGDRSPAIVPAVAAGYFWDPASAVDLGLVTFNVPEGNGVTTHNQVQPVVANQPTALTESGNAQFRMRNSVNANPSFIKTAGLVAAGWTGPTYVAGWLRLPDAGGIITSSNNFYFQHFLSTGNQRRLQIQATNNANNALDLIMATASVDGATTGTAAQWLSDFDVAAAWVWVECMIDPNLSAGGSGNASKVKLFYNFVLQAQVTAPSLDFTGLFDATAVIAIACRTSGTLANVDTTDWGPVYYANGIPSLGDREALMRTHAPA